MSHKLLEFCQFLLVFLAADEFASSQILVSDELRVPRSAWSEDRSVRNAPRICNFFRSWSGPRSSDFTVLVRPGLKFQLSFGFASAKIVYFPSNDRILSAMIVYFTTDPFYQMSRNSEKCVSFCFVSF